MAAARDPRRVEEDAGVERVEDEGEILEREGVFDAAVDAAAEEGDGQDQRAGDDHQRREPSQRRRHEEIRAGARRRGHGG